MPTRGVGRFILAFRGEPFYIMTNEEIRKCIESGNYSGPELLRLIAAELPPSQAEVLRGSARMLESMKIQLTKALETIVLK